jgi:hypothetical protein
MVVLQCQIPLVEAEVCPLAGMLMLVTGPRLLGHVPWDEIWYVWEA